MHRIKIVRQLGDYRVEVGPVVVATTRLHAVAYAIAEGLRAAVKADDLLEAFKEVQLELKNVQLGCDARIKMDERRDFECGVGDFGPQVGSPHEIYGHYPVKPE